VARDPRIEIPAVCEVHGVPRDLVIRYEGDRLVLGTRAGQCCVITLEGPAVTLLFDVLGEVLG
jgi:hypothetical protein